MYYLRFHHSDDRATLWALRGTYAFSKRSSVYATAGLIDNGGQLAMSVSSGATGANPKAGGNQFGAMLGMKHIF
ncbi:hypothetical protein CTP10_R18610 [Cupriavidus sp. P-10]|nr:hypothetical protein CTP10_R18610 [Cupriavidus sp. P-10]